MRQMVMVGFLQAQNCTNLVSSWRHPDSRDDSMSADYYRTIGRVLEEGKFHLGFFDDRLAMPDRYGNDHRHTVEHGIRCVKMDPVTVLTVMGMATERLGLGATCSTTYFEPFHVARVFATLDLMTGGRAAWNVVTSMNDGEALNMGHDEHLEHDSRYDRADEFMQVVLGHWNSWDDDAIVLDRQSGLFAHPDKVRRLDHQGTWFRSRGPFTVPRSPQGHPVVIQAGQSGRGKTFSARWGELVFVSTHTSMEHGRQLYREMKDDVARQGRDPDQFYITPSAYVVCAETKAEAEDKMALIETLATRRGCAVAAVGGDELRLRVQGSGRAVQRRRAGQHLRYAIDARPRAARQRHHQSDATRLRQIQPSRTAEPAVRRRPEGGGRWAGAMVHRAGRATASCWRRRMCRARIWTS